MTYILKENLISALEQAIYDQTERERIKEYSIDSALLAGWKQNLKI